MLHLHLTKSLGLLKQSVARCALVHSQALMDLPIRLMTAKVRYV